MSFPYKHVLVIGATAGIGRAMADHLISVGTKVTAVGRRQDRLQDFVSQHGESMAKSVAFDIGNLDEIPKFASDVMSTSPDIDSVFLNAGFSHPQDFSQPEKLDLADFNLMMKVNFTSFVALTHAFLPYLLAKKSETSLIFTGSNVAIIPAASLTSYSASKAALNSFVLCLRDDLRNSNVKVIEISPPPVQSEIHDYMGEKGRSFGMPVDEFTKKAFEGLVSGSDQIVIGSIGPDFNEIIDKRRATFEWLAKMMRGEATH